jgi:hypothetical protein
MLIPTIKRRESVILQRRLDAIAKDRLPTPLQAVRAAERILDGR